MSNGVVELFNKYYVRYDEWYVRNHNIALSERLCIEALAPHGRVLDIGVGTGYLTQGLSKTMIGVDPADKPLILASSRGFLTIRSYGEELPFRDSCFDTVLLVVTICFVDDPVKLLSEAYRVLKPGGRVIVCIVPRDSSWGQYYIMKKLRGESIFYEYARFYTVDEVVEMLSSRGFRVKRYCSTLTYKPPDPGYIEYPVLARIEDAGFTCIEAVKQ
ncbi:MAG: methyltransferase domain-containing protein [Thermoprotei archaeon]